MVAEVVLMAAEGLAGKVLSLRVSRERYLAIERPVPLNKEYSSERCDNVLPV